MRREGRVPEATSIERPGRGWALLFVDGTTLKARLSDGSTVSLGGGSGAPTTVDYLVKTASANLSAERVVTDTTTITWDWSTSGQAKASAVLGSGGALAYADTSAFTRSLLDDPDAATVRSTLGLVIGTNVQAWDADLDAYAALTGTGYVKRTGAGTASTTASVPWADVSSTPTTLAGYGIADGVTTSDARLSDARTPTAHAASHKNGGSDEIAISTAAANAIPKAGATAKLDIGWLPTGTTSTTVCIGNDGRLSDSRSPTAHAANHKSGGTDAIKLDELAAPTDVTTLNASTTAHGLLPKLDNTATNFLNGQGAWTVPSLSKASALITAEVTISAATYADITGASVSLAAGTWLVIGQVNCRAANLIIQAFVAITDGTGAVVSEAAGSRPASGTASLNSPFTVSVFAIVTPAVTTTYKLQAARGLTTHTSSWVAMDGNGVNTANHASNNTDKGTGIFAVRLA